MSRYQTLAGEEERNDGPESLEFKSFLGSENDGASGRPTDRESSPATASNSRESGNAAIWNIEYYQKYFDVDTKTVLSRCYHTMLPREDYVTVILDGRPDLYGPFWTLTTVIFALFVFSSLASSVTSWLSEKPWDYDFTLLTVAVAVVYSYGLGVPIALWAALKWLGVPDFSLLNAVAIWGYGMTVWIPVSLICIAPVMYLRSACVAIACGLSGFFLVRNIYPVLATAEAKSVRLVVILIAILHVGVAITFKVLFFSYYILRVGEKDPLGETGPL